MSGLPEIPLIDAPGEDWVLDALARETARTHALLDDGAGAIPTAAIRLADALSRRWLARHRAPQLPELDRIAALVGRPGAHYLNVSYEWGCTCAAIERADGGSLLARVLDWPDRGLGRRVLALRVASAVGRWLTLTWPGYAGVLHGVAPGRFAAALNQAPLDGPTGVFALDWLGERARVWRRPHPTASYLLRRVFETAPDYAAARDTLRRTPIAAGAIFTLAGPEPGQRCVIERRPDAAHVVEGAGDAIATNAWTAPGWRGLPRGEANADRRAAMAAARPDLDPRFGWLAPPILNDRTRLAFVADPASGRFVAQGFEADGPATAPLAAAA